MSPEYAALAARIRQRLQDVEKVVSRAEFLLNQAQQKEDDGYLDGVALNLHGFYGGIERMDDALGYCRPLLDLSVGKRRQ